MHHPQTFTITPIHHTAGCGVRRQSEAATVLWNTPAISEVHDLTTARLLTSPSSFSPLEIDVAFAKWCLTSFRMSPGDFSDAALVLIGHGSTLNAESAAPTYQHADELRRRGIFGQVTEAFWKLEPSITAVLRGVFARRVFAVPLFISEGYFTEEVIPRELGFSVSPSAQGRKFPMVRQRGEQTIYYCGPVGTHDSMTEVLLARARDVVMKYSKGRQAEPNETALFIAGHGTGNNDNSRKAIERQVELIRSRKAYAEVHAAFMEEAPRIGECYQLAQARNIVMVPFFISDGLHSYEDIPVMLGEPEPVVQERFRRGEPTWLNPTEKNGKRVWYAPSIGNEPHMAEVILERVREAAAVDRK